MAQAQDRQLAQCVELGSYQRADGKTQETAKFHLDNDDRREFEVLCNKYFKPVKGKFYSPIIDVISVAKYSEAKRRAYNKNQVVVRWQEVK